MEHALIDELVRLLCKAGGETFVGNFQKDPCKDLTAKTWKKEEIEDAVNYVKYMNEYFGQNEAKAIIVSLMAKYNILKSDLSLDVPTPEESALINNLYNKPLA